MLCIQGAVYKGRPANGEGGGSSIVKSVSYEELIKSGKKLEKVGTIGKKSFI